MLDYQTRLVAALRSLGADEELIRGAVADIAEFDEDDLVAEFGEPEVYADQLLPNQRGKGQYGLILSGIVLAVVIWIGSGVLAAAGVGFAEGIGGYSSIIALAVMFVGVLAEFFRYLRRGAISAESR